MSSYLSPPLKPACLHCLPLPPFVLQFRRRMQLLRHLCLLYCISPPDPLTLISTWVRPLRCVILARYSQKMDLAVASASILCCVETLWQLLKDAFAGVMGTVTGLLCPQCLSTSKEARDHCVPVSCLVPGSDACVGSFPVDTVKQLLKGALPPDEPNTWDGILNDGQLKCKLCRTPARSMTAQLHGLRMTGRSAMVTMLKEISEKAGQQIKQESKSRKHLTNATALLSKSVPLANSLAAIQRKVSLARALSQRSRPSKVTLALSPSPRPVPTSAVAGIGPQPTVTPPCVSSASSTPQPGMAPCRSLLDFR